MHTMTGEFPIITKLGGRKAVVAHLARMGQPRNLKTLRQWSWRRAIPGRAQTALLRVAREAGIAADDRDFQWTAAAEHDKAA